MRIPFDLYFLPPATGADERGVDGPGGTSGGNPRGYHDVPVIIMLLKSILNSENVTQV